MTKPGALEQEFKLFRICLWVTLIAPLVFLPLEHFFVAPAARPVMYGVIVFSVLYAAFFLRWVRPWNLQISVYIFITLHLLADSLAVSLHAPAYLIYAFFLVYSVLIGFSIMLVSWPRVLFTDSFIFICAVLFMLVPGSGYAAALAAVNLDPLFAITADLVGFFLVLILGTGLVHVKRRTEGELRELNKKLNQRVEEKVAEVQQTQEQLERILRHIPVGVVILDERLNVIYTNGVHFQFSLQEGKAREHPKTLLPLELLREQFLKEKAPRLLENREDLVGHRLEFIRPDQHLLIIRYSFVCVRLASEKGELLRLVLVTENITGEETLRNKLVRTNQLAEMGKMAASLVHAVNNPLAGIKLNLELMEMGLLNSDKREKIFATLTKGVNRIDRIIRSFLSFARQERPRKQWTRIQTILRDTLDMTANYQPYHGIQVRLECDQDLPAIAVDRLRLEQVFVNLINNARDAMTRGGGELLIHCGQEDEHLVIRVQDSGKGIKPEDLPKIFTPFFTTKERGHGTGLGLATSYGIIQEHGGSLEAESREGAGATFTIRLPIISQETKKGGG